jgi:hypothetical protein
MFQETQIRPKKNPLDRWRSSLDTTNYPNLQTDRHTDVVEGLFVCVSVRPKCTVDKSG